MKYISYIGNQYIYLTKLINMPILMPISPTILNIIYNCCYCCVCDNNNFLYVLNHE